MIMSKFRLILWELYSSYLKDEEGELYLFYLNPIVIKKVLKLFRLEARNVPTVAGIN